MQQHEIKNAFETFFNGTANFITPNVEGYRKSHNLIFELSSGRGIVTDTIYGVTVLEVRPDDTVKRPEEDLSQGGFDTKQDAIDYIESFRDKRRCNYKFRQRK